MVFLNLGTRDQLGQGMRAQAARSKRHVGACADEAPGRGSPLFWQHGQHAKAPCVAKAPRGARGPYGLRVPSCDRKTLAITTHAGRR
eukprot:COSAG02_NODE_2964_length_7645_cov_4.848927_7_plen_87_part_00